MVPITILIADDHALLRQGIRKVLELEHDLKIVGEAADGEETLKQVADLKPDILLLDINMPRINGLEVTRWIGQSGLSTRVVVLTIHEDENYVVELVKAGAAGYLLKDIEPGMLVSAIRKVHEGESFIYPSLASKLFGEITRREVVRRQAAGTRRRDERLTYREVEVLQLVGQGMSNQEIAHKLFLSEKTVKNHLTNIFRKINVTDRTQAVLFAIKNKIVVVE